MVKKNSIIDELKKNRKHINSSFDQVVENIVSSCLSNVRYTNSSGKTEMLYTIPAFMLGFPVYDYEYVSSRVVRKLRKEGFTIFKVDQSKIILKW
jgi:hypothetical protein